MDIFSLRRDFTLKSLDESDVLEDPLEQFKTWFDEAMKSKALEPNAMTLSTVDDHCKPSSRVVLLKQVKSDGFVFFTNYESKKASQLAENPHCALNFVWHELERQVRVEGRIEHITDEESDAYFESRPTKSKLGAWASPQSQEIPNRNYLEELTMNFEREFKDKEIPRPTNWGGYIVKPTLIEFWQGRSNRLHDRIQYTLDGDQWERVRLSP